MQTTTKDNQPRHLFFTMARELNSVANRHRLLPAVFLALACSGVMTAKAESEPMSLSDKKTVIVSSALATLTASFDYDAGVRLLAVHYQLNNRATIPFAVFDRGTARAGCITRLAEGEAATPYFVAGPDNTVTLEHAAAPLPNPPPTVPDVPLVARLEPGAIHAAVFGADVSLFAPPATRVRYCLAVMPFDAQSFQPLNGEETVDLWRAPFSVVDSQQRLCTPWFDLATQRFE